MQNLLFFFSLFLIMTGFISCNRPEQVPEMEINPQEKSAPATVSVRQRFQEAENYVLYYGGVKDEEQAQKLGEFDIIIIDPQSLGEKSKDLIAGWKSQGRIVIGYLSCMEIAPWNRYASRVPQEWILQVDGTPFIPFGDNRVASLDNQKWRNFITELIQTEVLDYGCDGVFMDTLADVDHPALSSEERNIQVAGLDALLAQFRTSYPDTIFIANWTLQATRPAAEKYADAITWENYNPDFFNEDAGAVSFMNAITEAFQNEQPGKFFRVLALWAVPADIKDKELARRKFAAQASKAGYLHYCCGEEYTHPIWPLDMQK